MYRELDTLVLTFLMIMRAVRGGGAAESKRHLTTSVSLKNCYETIQTHRLSIRYHFDVSLLKAYSHLWSSVCILIE